MKADRTAIGDAGLTVEEFERLPEEDLYRVELVRGVLVREPRPAAYHGWVQVGLGGALLNHVREHGLGFVFTDIGVILEREPDTVRGPDIAFVVADRLPGGPPKKGFLEFAPDLCVEIVSPSNRLTEIQAKVFEYLDAGTRLCWIVNPEPRTVTSYRSRTDVGLADATGEIDGDDVVPGFRLAVAELFSP
ncbi:MAG: Uma2 family endonuclease [Longimicrobiales bacterium]